MAGEKQKRPHGVQTKSIVRAIRTLEVLKENTDEHQFGDKYTFKKAIDEKHDEVEVTASAEGVMDWAILHMDRIEVLRPLELRKKIQEKAERLLIKYKN